MAAPFDVTYIPAAAALPPWLSYLSSPTATAEVPYTVATFASDGAPTLLTSAVRVTQYDTAILQLPLTVDPADVSGQDLGDVYTTAGGTAQTVVTALGGTRAFTLGTATRALAGGETSAAGRTEAGASNSQGEETGQSTSSDGPEASRTNPATSPATNPPTTSPAGTVPSADSAVSGSIPASSAPSVTISSLEAVRSSLSAALISATTAASVNPTSIASLESALFSASSALASASTAASVTAPSSLSSPLPSTTSQPSSALLPSTVTGARSSGVTDPASPSRSLHSLTPSQLAAAIAAPICFFFLILCLLILCCCCVRRRRRKRAENAALAEEEGEDGPGGAMAEAASEGTGLLGVSSGAAAAGMGAGGVVRSASRRLAALGGGSQRRKPKLNWEWVPPRIASPVSRHGSEEEGRTIRASGRSVLAWFGAGRRGKDSGRSTPLTGEDEETGPGMAENEGARPALRNVYGGATAPALLSARSASRHSSYAPVSPNPGHDQEDDQLQDVDLTSPRVNDGIFSPLPLHNEEEIESDQTHDPQSVPMLPPIRGTDGALRLSRYYTPPDDVDPEGRPPSQQPPPSQQQPRQPSPQPLSSSVFSPSSGFTSAKSPSSYDSPPLRTPPMHFAPSIPFLNSDRGRFGPVEATHSLEGLRDGYVSGTESDWATPRQPPPEPKRTTRLGYLSWSATGRPALPEEGEEAEAHHPEAEQLTPPQTPVTPDIRLVPGSASPDRSRPVVSEMGWLSGKWNGMMGSSGSLSRTRQEAQRHSDEEERVGTPEDGGEDSGGSRGSRKTQASSTLGESLPSREFFLNSPRWLGNRRQSSPPPFSQFNAAPPSPPSAYDPPFRPNPASNTSYLYPGVADSAVSASAYDDPPSSSVLVTRTPSLRALPDSPLVHPSPTGGNGKYRPRLSDGGSSVMGRIAATFGSVSGRRGGLAGLGIAEEDSKEDGLRSEPGEAEPRPKREREISGESATDPFQNTLPPRLPLRPQAAPTSPEKPSRELRRSRLQTSSTTPISFSPQHDALDLPVNPKQQHVYIDPFASESGGLDQVSETGGQVVWDGGMSSSTAVPEISHIRRVSD